MLRSPRLGMRDGLDRSAKGAIMACAAQRDANRILCAPGGRNLQKAPALEAAVVVDRGAPQIADGGDFGGLVLAGLPADLQEED